LQRLLQHASEIVARLDCLDVAKDGLCSEPRGESVGQTAGGTTAVVPTVTDEDGGRDAMLAGAGPQVQSDWAATPIAV
jgi:hypothetical protein